MHWLGVWEWDTGLCTALIVFGVTYAGAWWRLRRSGDGAATIGRLLCWYGGLIAVTVTAMSAIDELSLSYFSMHMIQHILFIDVAPPLLYLGRPLAILPALFTSENGATVPAFPGAGTRFVRALGFVLRAPAAWAIATVVICAWHLPIFYDYALAHGVVHDLGEHVSIFVAFLIWWHPLLGSVPQLPYLTATRHRFYYLLASILTTRGLGLVILFWPHVLYSYYVNNPSGGSLSLMTDQQLGGLIMLVGGMTVFLIMGLPLQYREEFPLTWP